MMTPPKPPRARKTGRPVQSAPYVALVPSTLSREEERMVERYRATDVKWRDDIVDFANMVAKMFPLVKEPGKPPAAGIRLATEDGKKVPK